MNKQDLIPVICQEECAEVIQAISKVFRFGLDQVHPETGISNRVHLSQELGQLRHMMNELFYEWNLDREHAHEAQLKKAADMHKWFDYFPKETNE